MKRTLLLSAFISVGVLTTGCSQFLEALKEPPKKGTECTWMPISQANPGQTFSNVKGAEGNEVGEVCKTVDL